MKSSISVIQGGIAIDQRGQIRYVNEFDMTLVKRFYIIKNVDTELIRGWRAHRIEQRWFYVLSGAFSLDLVWIDDWEKPSRQLPVQHLELRSSEMKVLNVPAGYGTAFKAIEPNSELLVYADHGFEHAKFDDYIFPPDYFDNCSY
ncbi:WxcM-like domain-containing protein [Sphingobacterium thalpophilum]|uniref:WxcM-like domain-containing protein n=1 Tax=Sphingobacterium thalpophilum TaxID=259 RepID=UPI0031DFCFB2